MAPRRGSSGGGSNSYGEATVPLDSPSSYRANQTTYRDVAIVMGVATSLYVLLFICSLCVTNRHPKSHVWRLVATSLFFTILHSALMMADRIVRLTTYEVVESYFLISGWWSMFALIVDLLLLAACWGFLHNRLRAVGVRKKSVSAIAGLHWFLLTTMSCLALFLAVGWWLQSALYVADLKAQSIGHTTRLTYATYVGSKFFRVHLKNVGGAWAVLLWIWVLEMMVVAITLAVKEARWKPAAHVGVLVKKTYASLIFLFCVLLPLFAATLGIMVMTFRYWKLERVPRNIEVTYASVQAFPAVAAFAGLCVVGMYLTPDQWARENREWDGAHWGGGMEQNQNYPPQQLQAPPQHYDYPPQEQYGWVP